VRATRDLDLTYHGPGDDLATVLEDALVPFGRFHFQRSGGVHRMEHTDTIRIDLGVRFDGTTWGTVPLDVTRRDGCSSEIEMVDALDLHQRFRIEGPRALPCLSLRYHLAHKLHAVTRPDSPDYPNHRVQDLVDLLVFGPELHDPRRRYAIREACIETFAVRATHAWPPAFLPPRRWNEPFARYADEMDLSPATLADATASVAETIAALDAARGPFT
jgi:hypothetical protein